MDHGFRRVRLERPAWVRRLWKKRVLEGETDQICTLCRPADSLTRLLSIEKSFTC